MNRLAIFGAGGHGKVVADCAFATGWKEINFFDEFLQDSDSTGIWNIVGNKTDLKNNLMHYDGVVVAIGDNIQRQQIFLELLELDAALTNVIHPSAYVSKHIDIGIGCVIMAGAVINIGSRLGNNCIINTGATIDHDCILGNGVHISPGVNLAGGVTVGNCSWVGIGATVRQKILIGSESIVGAGSVVIKDVGGNKIVVGVPARELTK